MAVFQRIPKADLHGGPGSKFTHRGRFLFCPVYIGGVRSEAPLLEPRNWVPDWLFWVALGVFALGCWLHSLVDPFFEPAFPVTLTGRLDGQSLRNEFGGLR